MSEKAAATYHGADIVDRLDVTAPHSEDGALLTESAATIRDLRAKAEPTQFVLSEREAELLAIKGHCSNADCRLHYAHRGPCDVPALTNGARP